MILHTHTLLASQSHRRMVDPITFAARRRPFIVERVSTASDASPASPPKSCDPAVEAGGVARIGEGGR